MSPKTIFVNPANWSNPCRGPAAGSQAGSCRWLRALMQRALPAAPPQAVWRYSKKSGRMFSRSSVSSSRSHLLSTTTSDSPSKRRTIGAMVSAWSRRLGFSASNTQIRTSEWATARSIIGRWRRLAILSVSGVSIRHTPSGRRPAPAGRTSTPSAPRSRASSAASLPPRSKITTRSVVGRSRPDGEISSPPAKAFTRVDLPDPEGPMTVTTRLRSSRSAMRAIMCSASSHCRRSPAAGRHRPSAPRSAFNCLSSALRPSMRPRALMAAVWRSSAFIGSSRRRRGQGPPPAIRTGGRRRRRSPRPRAGSPRRAPPRRAPAPRRTCPAASFGPAAPASP